MKDVLDEHRDVIELPHICPVLCDLCLKYDLSVSFRSEIKYALNLCYGDKVVTLSLWNSDGYPETIAIRYELHDMVNLKDLDEAVAYLRGNT